MFIRYSHVHDYSPSPAAGAAGAGGAAAPAAGGGGRFEEYGGIDPSIDPELAMALRISMEEARAAAASGEHYMLQQLFPYLLVAFAVFEPLIVLLLSMCTLTIRR